MTRGNQRDKDRARSQKRAETNKNHDNKEGLTASQRKERDAAIMREKQQKALQEKKEAPAKP